MASRADDERWMRLAIGLGKRGLGQVWPNPAVGCVIVRYGRVIGRGSTQAAGRPHAETEALAQAGSAAEGATAYVSLEPCAHHGKTPPCAEALIAAKVARVVSAMQDPDPRVAGQGHARLRAAGIKVETDILAAEAEDANIGFLTRMRQGRPSVTLKLAMTLDGKIATRTGDSQWITGPEARAYTHLLRANHDAIMVGSGTVLADDPDLRVRHHGLEQSSPVRVVLDTTLKTPADSKLVQSATETPVWLCHDEAATPDKTWGAAAAVLLPCRVVDRTLDVGDVLQSLGNKGITRLFSEGGAAVAASLLRAGVVDRLIVMMAGAAIGNDGLSALGSLGIAALADAPRFRLHDVRRLGQDVVADWRA
jgi:diaminohydroxyphosphoribosylaminopyrimidine deaminase/5-amino-6-(5-phosphoribosylamino)uracil reductase